MLNIEIKEEADGLAEMAEDMTIPMILVGPLLNTTPDEWRRITYSFLSLKRALEEKMKIPIQLAMVDCDSDISTEVLDSLGITPEELEMRELRENGMF